MNRCYLLFAFLSCVLGESIGKDLNPFIRLVQCDRLHKRQSLWSTAFRVGKTFSLQICPVSAKPISHCSDFKMVLF